MSVLKVDYKAENAAEQFSTSLKNAGFAIITNHSIPTELFNEAYQTWGEFFNSTSKTDYPFDSMKQDGFFPVGAETAKGHHIADLKEFYQYYANGRLPESVREITLTLRSKLFDLATDLLRWLEETTPKEIQTTFPCTLRDMLSNDNTMCRIIHYPPFSGSETPGAVRAQEHSDINFLTALPAGSAKGLQVKNTAGEWIDVPCDPGSISINTGDMMEMLTGGYYPSTIHRVINPSEITKSTARMSMPLFLHPKSEIELKPGLTAGEFLDQRLKEIGNRSESE